MARNLNEVVEKILKKTSSEKKCVLTENDFIDLLNWGLENTSIVDFYSKNRKTGRTYEQKIRYKGEWGNCEYITHTSRKIYNIFEGLKLG